MLSILCEKDQEAEINVAFVLLSSIFRPGYGKCYTCSFWGRQYSKSLSAEEGIWSLSSKATLRIEQTKRLERIDSLNFAIEYRFLSSWCLYKLLAWASHCIFMATITTLIEVDGFLLLKSSFWTPAFLKFGIHFWSDVKSLSTFTSNLPTKIFMKAHEQIHATRAIMGVCDHFRAHCRSFIASLNV